MIMHQKLKLVGEYSPVSPPLSGPAPSSRFLYSQALCPKLILFSLPHVSFMCVRVCACAMRTYVIIFAQGSDALLAPASRSCTISFRKNTQNKNPKVNESD